MQRHRIIFANVSIDDLELAARAARYGLTRMPHRDAIVAYGDAPATTDFHVRRRKSALVVTLINAPAFVGDEL
jgi:hypothetical protein